MDESVRSQLQFRFTWGKNERKQRVEWQIAKRSNVARIKENSKKKKKI